jgi:hypothetical protein
MKFQALPVATALALAFAAPVQAGGGHAHEHGVTFLDIVVDGTRLALDLQAAGHHLVGFEHVPETAEQRAAWAAVEVALADAGALFQPEAGAGCRLASAKLMPPGTGQAERSPAHSDHSHAHDAGADARAHAGDWRAEYRFDCAAPERLRGIAHALFRAFPATEEVRWQVFAPAGQDGGVLRAGQERIPVPQAR